VLAAIAEASTKEFLLRILGALAIIVLLCGAWILHLRAQLRQPLSSKFDFDEFGGFYVERKSRVGVCARCLADGVVVHLMDLEGNKKCNACKSQYRGRPKNP
jgi:hypothetical protein